MSAFVCALVGQLVAEKSGWAGIRKLLYAWWRRVEGQIRHAAIDLREAAAQDTDAAAGGSSAVALESGQPGDDTPHALGQLGRYAGSQTASEQLCYRAICEMLLELNAHKATVTEPSTMQIFMHDVLRHSLARIRSPPSLLACAGVALTCAGDCTYSSAHDAFAPADEYRTLTPASTRAAELLRSACLHACVSIGGGQCCPCRQTLASLAGAQSMGFVPHPVLRSDTRYRQQLYTVAQSRSRIVAVARMLVGTEEPPAIRKERARTDLGLTVTARQSWPSGYLAIAATVLKWYNGTESVDEASRRITAGLLLATPISVAVFLDEAAKWVESTTDQPLRGRCTHWVHAARGSSRDKTKPQRWAFEVAPEDAATFGARSHGAEAIVFVCLRQ